MNSRIGLNTVLGAVGNQSEQAALFAFIGLGIVEALTNGLMSACDAVRVFFHAANCVFVRKELRVKAADDIMSHGVQLPDLFDALPADQAQREFSQELVKIRDLCLRLLGQKRSAA